METILWYLLWMILMQILIGSMIYFAMMFIAPGIVRISWTELMKRIFVFWK